MVKVHINTRPDPQYLPLFITPASPPMKVTGHPVPESIPFEKQGDHHTLRPPPNMSPALEPNGLGNTTRDNQHELPAALRVGQDIPNHWTSNASTSLQVAPSDLTPRSSSESQRSATFTPQAQHSTTTAYQMTNNPYHRMNTREPDLSLPAPVRAGNSTAVWADEPNNVSGGPYGFHNQCESHRE